MASTFKFHSQVAEAVPWNAQYTFPTQATKVQKQIVKLPAKNGSSFSPGQVVRIEFPSDNYLNVLNSYLLMDIKTVTSSGTPTRIAWQRGGAQNAIKRLRILYGSLVIEDIQEYHTLVRIFHECGIPQDYRESSGSILDGMQANMNVEDVADAVVAAGAYATPILGAISGDASTTTAIKLANTLSATDNVYNGWEVTIYSGLGVGQTRRIKSYAGSTNIATLDAALTTAPTATGSSLYRLTPPVVLPADTVGNDLAASGVADVSDNSNYRTYCLNLLSGLLTCKKLIPLKWMAAQLAIEITLTNANEAMLYDSGVVTYTVNNPQFVSEMIEFDSTYDQAFFMGLQQGGVPLKFSSWHYHSFGASGTTNAIQIHERARSVKAGFAVFRDQTAIAGDKLYDSDRFFHAPGQTFTSGVLDASTRQTGSILEFQWRVGGRYYPSQPVRCIYGAAEAYVELCKAINTFGDYTSASAINYYNWSSYAGQGDRFIMACEFENTDVLPNTIAGINAEEQSDIALSIKCAGTGVSTAANNTRQIDVFMHYDSLLVVRDGNVVDLIM